jgi:hypothetical protein
MIDVFTIVTICWLTAVAGYSFYRLAIGDQHPAYFGVLIHYAFFGLPLFLNYVYGLPTYERQAGLALMSDDATVQIIYCLYMLLVPLILLTVGRPRHINNDGGTSILDYISPMNATRLRWVLLFFALLPVGAFFLAPEKQIFAEYGEASQTLYEYSVETQAFFHYVALVSTLSVIAITGLLLLTPRLKAVSIVPYLPLLAVATWLNGKRFVLAVILLLVCYVYWQRGILRGMKLLAVTGVLAVMLHGFSFYYMSTVRGFNLGTRSQQQLYDDFRIDFGRDHTVKMVLFAELNPDKLQVLEYRGQSLAFYAVMAVPRAVWPEKPWPYAVYFTSAMTGVEPGRLYWGMTTSILDEAIANLSWWGMLIGPLLLALICRLGATSRSLIGRLLTPLIVSLFLTVHLAAFWPLFLLWAMVLLKARFRFRVPQRAVAMSLRPAVTLGDPRN